MIQLSTLPQTGAIPGVRVAGFALGTTSDFALALADVAGASRQPLAVDGKGLPITGDGTTEIAMTPQATKAGLGIARLPAIATQPVVDFGIIPPRATDLTGVADAPAMTPAIDPTLGTQVGVSVTPSALSKSDAVVDVSKIDRTLAEPPLPDIPARSRRAKLDVSPDIAPVAEISLPSVSIVAERTPDVASAADAAIGDPAAMLAAPTVPAPFAPPAITASVPPPTRTIAVTPQATALAADTAPISELLTTVTPRSGKIAAGPQSAPVARPVRAVQAAIPMPVSPVPPNAASPSNSAVLTPRVEAIVTRATSPCPAPRSPIQGSPAVQPTTVIASQGDVSAPPPVASPAPVAFVSTALPAPVANVPATPTVPATPIAVTPDVFAPAERISVAAVTITIVASPAATPPTPQLQPAAQAFAAAMFAARSSVDATPLERDDDLSFALASTAAPTTLNPSTLAVAATPQGQQPTLDLTKSDWMASMIDRIETLRDDSGGVRETRMKLSPEALGGIEVSVRRDETGAIQVRIAADTAQARALLSEAAPKLAEMAEARGVKLGGSSVDAHAGSADQGRRDAPNPAQRRPAPVAAADPTDIITDTRLA